ncbi:hypothetical protein L6452_03268 [Arctium lappa]|uniref:Uncharacterized protein n=1 Tax=Arctium lappa TaxID=4217 RepID=A0ACB9FMC0_ARCLA|nr:hypothetical protein L6452_03268 [Arctium lappa]
METSLQISQPYRAAMELRIAAAAVAPGCVVDQRNNRRLFVDLELILVGLINSASRLDSTDLRHHKPSSATMSTSDQLIRRPRTNNLSIETSFVRLKVGTTEPVTTTTNTIYLSESKSPFVL